MAICIVLEKAAIYSFILYKSNIYQSEIYYNLPLILHHITLLFALISL